jgi:putative ABC transport system permease protein
VPAAVLITAQSVLDQRNSHVSDSTAALVNPAAGGHSVSSRWRATISSGASSRLVIGVTPGDWYAAALYQPITDRDRLWDHVAVSS